MQHARPFQLPDLRGPLNGPWRTLARPACESLLGLHGLQRIYEGAVDDQRDIGFWDRVLTQMRTPVDINLEDLHRAIGDGGAIIVANHPFGAPEAVALGALLERIRPDSRFLANRLIARIPELREKIFEADVFEGDGAVERNAASMRDALRWVRQGHVLAIFPAGEVSHWRNDLRAVADPDWHESVGGLIRLAKAPVVPVHIEGSNGALFSLAGLLHPRLRTALLPWSVIRRKGRAIRMRAGRAIPVERIARFESNDDLVSYLRVRTYVLADAVRRANEPVVPPAAPVADERPAASIRAEIEALPADRTLVRHGVFRVLVAEADEIPNALLEIGRLREVAFRALDEGVGQARDLDEFDATYQHLIVWDDDADRIAGCYRIGPTDRILEQSGVKGLYTYTLFDFDRTLIEQISPALELGRSFVHPDYQKHFAPLMLLWKGIGAFAVRHPRYRYLFGPVSISASYASMSKLLLTQFLSRNHHLPALAAAIQPRRPIRLREPRLWRSRDFSTVVRDLGDVDAIMGELEADGKTTPVLVRQYLKLNAVLLGFNTDPLFGDVVDGLMLCDLTTLDPRVAVRYMGETGAAAYLAHHGITLRRPALHDRRPPADSPTTTQPA